MSNYEQIEPLKNGTGASTDPQVKLLSQLIQLSWVEQNEGRHSTARRKLISRLPDGLTAKTLDDWDSGVQTRYSAKELLTTNVAEGTNLLQEQVARTVVAGADKAKVIRNIGANWSTVKSNAYRWPLGATQYNADIVREGEEIPVKTEEYSKATSSPKKRGIRPPVTFEMVEMGEFDTIAEEIFYAGAACENVLNYDALTVLCTAATGASNNTTTGSGATAGTALSVVREGVGKTKGNGFIPDTIIMCTLMETDVMANATMVNVNQSGSTDVLRKASIPQPFFGCRVFVTDNGSTTVDGTNPWAYDSDNDVGGVCLNARQGCGVHMLRDLTVRRFENFTHELHDISCTIIYDVKALQAEAIYNLTWQT